MSGTKEKKKKIHSSTFHITVQSNQTSKDYNSQLQDAFVGFYKSLDKFLKIGNDTYQAGLAQIHETACEAAIEVGGKQHRVHIHALLKITHSTCVQLNVASMNKYFLERVGTKCYIHVRFIRDQSVNIRNYIRK